MIAAEPAVRVAAAFDSDVHFSLTLALAVAAGFTEDEAFELAKYDQATDDDPKTSPLPGLARGLARQQRIDYHAFGPNGITMIAIRRAEVRCIHPVAVTQRDYRTMGHYLHALEDQFAHRCCGPTIGQGTLWDMPDRPYYAPSEFVTMVRRKFEALGSLRRQCWASGQSSKGKDVPEYPVMLDLLEKWRDAAYDYAAEGPDNPERWDNLQRAMYGPKHSAYVDQATRRYLEWKRGQDATGWRTP
jgi:hypothetical protein